MKTSGHLIFYISESEDFELWRVLTQITPEDRAAFIKNALKKALLEESGRKTSTSSSFVRNDKALGDAAINDLALEELGYDAIAASLEKTYKPFSYFSEQDFSTPQDLKNSYMNFQMGEDELQFTQLEEILKPTVHESNSSIPGLDFLLNNVIGEEQDEEVIDFIRKMREELDEDSES